MATHTLRPTSPRALRGTRTLFSSTSRTPRRCVGTLSLLMSLADVGFSVVHPWYEDGVCWSEEGQGPQRPHHVPQGGGTFPRVPACSASTHELRFRPHKNPSDSGLFYCIFYLNTIWRSTRHHHCISLAYIPHSRDPALREDPKYYMPYVTMSPK